MLLTTLPLALGVNALEGNLTGCTRTNNLRSWKSRNWGNLSEEGWRQGWPIISCGYLNWLVVSISRFAKKTDSYTPERNCEILKVVDSRYVIIRGKRRRTRFEGSGRICSNVPLKKPILWLLCLKLCIRKTANIMVRNVIVIQLLLFGESLPQICKLSSSPTRRINYFRSSGWMFTPIENEHFRFTLRRIILRHDFRLNMLIYRIIIATHWQTTVWCMIFTIL